jgi:hypothetical protein
MALPPRGCSRKSKGIAYTIEPEEFPPRSSLTGVELSYTTSLA